jgi:anaerobic sulfite reductase subunit C
VKKGKTGKAVSTAHSSGDMAGFLRQRQPGFFILRLKMPVGRLESGQLPVLAGIAKKYGRGELHLTTRQGIEIPWISEETIPELKKKIQTAGIAMGASGPRIRVITACPGSRVCRHGIIDAQGFGTTLDAVYTGTPVPHKFKIAVAGCPNACTKPRENDIGFAGAAEPRLAPEKCISCKKCLRTCREEAILFVDDTITLDPTRCENCGDCITGCPEQALTLNRSGLTVYIGGKMGRHPVLGTKIAEFVDEKTATGYLDRVLVYYRREGRPRERLADTLTRVGIKEGVEEIRGLEEQHPTLKQSFERRGLK